MSSIIEGYQYDIFISYRQKDNKGGRQGALSYGATQSREAGWVSEFVDALKTELESTFKEDISVYFDINPHDGLLETHSVDKSLEGKLRCLIFIPVISQTYCDSKSFAWQHEFCVFNRIAKEDQFGRDIKLASGNVASRILPVKIHDLDPEDNTLLENELRGFIRGIEFIYKEPGVNRPLKSEDDEKKNLNNTIYRNQINKVANAVKEVITALKKQSQHQEEVSKQDFEVKPVHKKNLRTKIIIASFVLLALMVLGYFFIPKLKPAETIEKSIAVLPFDNLSNDPEQEYFSDGMVDAILDNLCKIGDLKVISRTSTMRYKKTQLSLKEIAHELGVVAILEGSVHKIGNNVRITAQLIDTRTDTHLWSEKYDRNLSDIFSIYSEVAQNIARELKATMTSEETDRIQKAPPTTNQLAYDFFLRGKDFFSRYKSTQAVDMYTKAIQEDPLFAEAYINRAKAHLYLFWIKDEGTPDHDLKALNDLNRVILLNPKLLEIKITQAIYSFYVKRDYDNALRIIKEIKAKSPNIADLHFITSWILRRQGKWEESISEFKLGMQLDPFNPRNINELANTYALMHQYDNQIGCAKQGLLLMPDYKNFMLQIFNAVLSKYGDLEVALKESGLKQEDVLGTIYYFKGEYAKLIELIRKDSSTQADNQFRYEPKTYELAEIYYLNGDKSRCKLYTDSAITHLKEKIKEIPNDDRFNATLGKCYGFIGNTIEAVECGKRAIILKPMKLDAWQGVIKEQDLMEIYVLTKNYDLAMDKMEYLISIPSGLSVGKLLADPIFDNLRSLPRFQKIIENARKQVL